MKLTYWKGPPPNFGDEINALVWHHFVPPDFFDEDDRELFLGIGSIILDEYPPSARKIVVGSGWGGYSATLPNVHDGTWQFVWVRGPWTAAQLKLDLRYVITDAAVLLRRLALPLASKDVGVAFMPHVDSLDRGDWATVCRLADITFLDPRAPLLDLLALIRGARVVVTEAMHGAIVADALRTPWIALLPSHPIHRAKWLDWSASLGLELRSTRLIGSTAREVYTQLTGFAGLGWRSRLALDGIHAAPADIGLRHLAARALRRISEQVEPQLSDDLALERATTRCEEALAGLVATRRVLAG